MNALRRRLTSLALLTTSAVCAAVGAGTAGLTGCPAEPAPGVTMTSAVFADAQGVVTPLVCPGARGCETATGALRVGAAARAITPDLSTPAFIAGFSLGRQATGVHDDVEARALVMAMGDVTIGLVALDTIGWFQQDALRVRQAVATAGLELDHVVVHSTHNHESKDTMGIWGPSAGESGYDESYMQFVTAQIVAALQEAHGRLVPATLRVAQGDAGHLVNDTRLPHVRDDAISILHFDDTAGAPVATWLVWGNHPEALGSNNTLITSDFPHYLRAEVERLLPGTTAVFTSGTLGGLTTTIGLNVCPEPEDPSVDLCPQGTFERAEVVGVGAARIAVAALADAPVSPPALALRRAPAFFVPDNLPLLLAFQVGLLPRTVYDRAGILLAPAEVAQLSIVDLRSGEFVLASEVNALRVGDVELLLVPGEVYAELFVTGEGGASLIEIPAGADFPDATPETPLSTLMPPDARLRLTLNQTNDSVGYILPKTQWDVEAPRAYREGGQYGEQNSLGPDTAPTLVEAVAALYALTVE